MAADGLAPCIARSSAAKVQTTQDKQVFAFHEEISSSHKYRLWKKKKKKPCLYAHERNIINQLNF